jgi:hypothetical protein
MPRVRARSSRSRVASRFDVARSPCANDRREIRRPRDVRRDDVKTRRASTRRRGAKDGAKDGAARREGTARRRGDATRRDARANDDDARR